MVAVFSGGEKYGCLFVTGNVFIDGAVVHLVRITEAFGMTTRIVGKVSHVIQEAWGSALEDLIAKRERAVALGNPLASMSVTRPAQVKMEQQVQQQ